MTVVNVRKQRGAQGEELVARYVSALGFTVVARNYSRRQGEIDLIARHNNVLAFIEVKARMHSFFDLTELISISKQKRIVATAKSFIIEHAYDAMVFRFDVALIENLDTGEITYIPNAFTESEY